MRGVQAQRSYLERLPAPWIRPDFVRRHGLVERDRELFPRSVGSLADTETTFYLTCPHFYLVGSHVSTFALESGPHGESLHSGYVKVTNLTGGRPAHCGGELWFTDPSTIIFTGSAGYPVRGQKELDDLARAFERAGFDGGHMGFDAEVGMPSRVLRGP